jgi:hypothetical protein
MGMREAVPSLYIADLVLKDRDRFILLFSGFINTSNSNSSILQDYNIPNIMSFSQSTVIH